MLHHNFQFCTVLYKYTGGKYWTNFLTLCIQAKCKQTNRNLLVFYWTRNSNNGPQILFYYVSVNTLWQQFFLLHFGTLAWSIYFTEKYIWPLFNNLEQLHWLVLSNNSITDVFLKHDLCFCCTSNTIIIIKSMQPNNTAGHIIKI